MNTSLVILQRYNSEYKSHYKQFSSKRPETVKGELTRSVIPYGQESHVSTPRAGLQSTQLGVIHEPPIQRKKIVPYEKNHNILATGTVKELSERDWLKVDETARDVKIHHTYTSKVILCGNNALIIACACHFPFLNEVYMYITCYSTFPTASILRSCSSLFLSLILL